MQTNTLVRASAQVVTITTLRAGDVYKRLTKRWDNNYDATFGVVQTVDHNGEAAMISSLEISAGKIEHKVFGTDTDLQIFATTPEEVEHALDQHHASIVEAHRVAAESVAKAVASMERFSALRAQIDDSQMQQPAVVVSSSAQEISA